MPKRKAWYLGNTTVRNPKRLKAGLIALINSPLHGNLEGRENEKEFVRLLDTAGVLYSKRLHESPEQDFSDQGRKWRAALMQLGFITPGSDELKQIDPTERPFSLTQNGQRLVQAQTLP